MTSDFDVTIFASQFSTRNFFYKEHFYKQRQAEIDKKSSKAKQHTEAEVLLFQNYSLFSSTLSPKTNRRYCRKYTKKQVRLFKWGYMINDFENEAENKK